jgi:hypothetical protein
MSQFVRRLVLASLLPWFVDPRSAMAQNDPTVVQSTDEASLVLPLVYRTSQQGVLLTIFGKLNPKELETAAATCRLNKMAYEQSDNFNKDRKDYSQYHLIVGGTNCMDYWTQAKEPAAFDHIERFVAEGGHLVLFGTFDGRNCEHLQRFGIKTSSGGANGFRTVPGRSNILFSGIEGIAPANRKLASTGSFSISVPHVVLLQRAGTQKDINGPALATLSYKKGRVTYTQAEPGAHEADVWLVSAVMTWAARGAPTSLEQLDQQVVLDEQTLANRRRIKVLAIPPETEQRTAEQTIREAFRDEFSAAAKSDRKLTLANKLVQTTQTEANPATVFVCLRLARDLYAESGNPAKAFTTIDQLGERFQIDIADMQLEAVRAASKTMRDPITASELAKVCLDLADDLAVVGRYDVATTVANLAKSAAQTAKHRHYQSLIVPLTRRLGVIQKESDRIKPFRQTLATDSTNAEANMEVGKFQCLILRNWEVGLPQLAQGSDPALRQLAAADQNGSDDPNAQVALGDFWVAQSSKLTSATRPAASSRARFWYSRALSKMSGLEKTVLEKKIAKIPTTKFELRFALNVAGKAELRLTKDRMSWKQLSGPAPKTAQVNTQFWSVATQGDLKNHGSTRYFLEEVDLDTATLAKLRGRNAIELKLATSDELLVELTGDDDYEFVLRFGN